MTMDKGDPRRARILAAAQQVFANEGFRSAEVKTVAEKASVGKATIYKFFDSKEALLLTIVDENLSQLRDLVLSNLIGNQKPMKRLENTARSMAKYMSDNIEFTRVLIQEAGEFMGDIQRRHLQLLEQNLPIADAFFNELRKDGYFQALNTRETMDMLMNFMIGIAYNMALNGVNKDPDLAVRYMRVLTEGLKTPPEVINQ